jgi:hypothetical protein
MRDVPHIWEAWRSGGQVGEMAPCTRVTVEKNWYLNVTGATVGTWTRGPARWYQPEDRGKQQETEVPNVLSVNMTRSLDSDAGTCDIVILNQLMPAYGQPETPTGQFGNRGALTFDHGVAQDARARWSHAVNAWQGVLVPNALLRTYQGYGGHDKPIRDAVADGNLVLNGVWLVDDVNIGSDGNISLKCRDMMKLLVDQQLFPPLVPPNLYPAKYQRWRLNPTSIPTNLPPPASLCYGCQYLNSSTDQHYGEWNTLATGHPGTDAFDISPESQRPFAHQATFWLSEPLEASTDSAWIEFLVYGGAVAPVNEIYFHPFEGQLLQWPAEGMFYVMVSVFERGAWAAPDTDAGGMTPQGIPYVSTFVPGEGPDVWSFENDNLFRLPRHYWATAIRLTVTNLIPAWEGGWRPPDEGPWPTPPGEGGFRAGARKIDACSMYRDGDPNFNNITFAGATIPVNTDERTGYWQVRSNGQVYAFGDARTYPTNSPRATPRQLVVGMVAHPSGRGYWTVDDSGVVISAGEAYWNGDLADDPNAHTIDIARTPDGSGYWLLNRDGSVHPFGSAPNRGSSSHEGYMFSGVRATAESITAHPIQSGYWVLWTDGHITAHGVTHRGHAPQAELWGYEFFTAIKATATGNGYYVLASLGGVHVFGDAVHHGNATAGPVTQAWFYGVCWDLLMACEPQEPGYFIQHANGMLDPCGKVIPFGSIGTGVSQERSPGNYKDYSDIVKDLLLWAGFYLKPEVQPANRFPAVFGNIESTGAWAASKEPGGGIGALPTDMFEKRSIYDAIKDLRDIVGYLFYVDQEGGARFESPSWWALGNWLMGSEADTDTRIPYGEMPEVDESVNLQNHSISYSGQSAYSEIILATEDPMPREEGKPAPTGITQTRLVPKTAPDLRGMTHLFMRTHMELSNKNEQKVMADLIDMKMWFSRRMGSLSCAANPLIDLNDQIRVIERTTGEVYIHYIRSIETSHDIESGDFTMNITTHWLGGGPFEKFTLFYAGVIRPQSDGYWTVTLGGTIQNDFRSGVYASGRAALHTKTTSDSHTEDVISMRSTPSGNGFYTVDRTGKVITYGDAVHHGDLFVPYDARDKSHRAVVGMALTSTGSGYWIIQGNGTVTAFGDAIHHGNADIGGTIGNGSANFATDIEGHPHTNGYWTLTANGTIGAFGIGSHGNATRPGVSADDNYVTLRHTSDAGGYWAVTGGGVVSNHGNAPHYGNGTAYPADQWFYGLVWDLLAYDDNSYALLHADGSLEAFGGFTLYSPVVRYDSKYWALVPADRANAMSDQSGIFAVSRDVIAFLSKTGSPAAANALASNFGVPSDAQKSLT